MVSFNNTDGYLYKAAPRYSLQYVVRDPQAICFDEFLEDEVFGRRGRHLDDVFLVLERATRRVERAFLEETYVCKKIGRSMRVHDAGRAPVTPRFYDERRR